MGNPGLHSSALHSSALHLAVGDEARFPRPQPDLSGPVSALVLASLVERAVAEHAHSVEQRITALGDAVGELRRTLHSDEDAATRAELLSYQRRLAEVEGAAQQQIAALSEALAAIRKSTSWRMTEPLRKLAKALPREQRSALRRLARRSYWLVTPHRWAMRKHWAVWAPQNGQSARRLRSLSVETRQRVPPLRLSYGPTAVEQLDVYRTTAADAPIFMMIHGGHWHASLAKDAAFAAETFTGAGAHYVVPDFIGEAARGDLRVIAEQVLRSIAWVYRNAASFGGDPTRLYVGGHSSGGHLAALALVTDWPAEWGLPADLIKGALLMSGIYDLRTVRSLKYSRHLVITDEIEQAFSPHRHVAALRAPFIASHGGAEAPEFRRQSQAFVAAAKAADKPAELIEAAHFGHIEMVESLASPYGPNGRAALRLMQLAPR